MPNHFTTVGLCGRDWNRLEALGKEDIDEIDLHSLNGKNLCEILNPRPQVFDFIVDSNTPRRYRHKVTGEFLKDVDGPMGKDRGAWEMIELTAKEQHDLKGLFGAVTWHGWQCLNWGTKWGIYDLKTHELGGDGSPVLVEFQSAWGPPNADMMRRIDNHLCETFCLENIKWFGHDPGNGQTVEIEIADAVSV